MKKSVMIICFFSTLSIYSQFSNKKNDTIHFDYSNEIILKTTINGELYNFLFDTGGYTMISTKLQEKFKFPVKDSKDVNSNNNISRQTDVVFIDSMSIGNMHFKNVSALCVDFKNSPALNCSIDGIIGADLIKEYIWQIDYPNKKIVISNEIKNFKLSDAYIVPVYLNSHYQPYLKAMINAKSLWMMFDTGSAALSWMSTNDLKNFRELPKKAVILNKITETHNGTTKSDLAIFSANIMLDILKLENIPIMHMQQSKLTVIGNPIIKKYTITLNFPDNKIYFSPIRNASALGGLEHFGFDIVYREGRQIIVSLIEGSYAAKAGLQPNDIVTAINGKAIPCNNFCDCTDYFATLLETSAEISLTIKKGDGLREIKLSKEKIF